MIKMRFNAASWSAKAKQFSEMAETEVKQELKDVARILSTRAPVDTGAYAESFSVSPSAGGVTRSRSSRNRPRKQDVTSYQQKAYNIMSGDIDSLDLVESQNTSIAFRNRAPHARKVEIREQVFGVAKDIKR